MIEKQNGIIKSAQLFILLFTIKNSIIILTPFNFQSNYSLIDILLPSIITFLLYLVCLIIIIYYKNNDSNIVYSSKIYSFIYIIVLSYFCILFMLRLFSFCRIYLSDEINDIIILISLFFAAIFGANKGIEAIVRYSLLLFLLIIISVITIVVFIYPSFNNDIIKALNQESIINSGNNLFFLISESPELIVLFLCSPFTKDSIKKNGIAWLAFQSVFMLFMLILISGTLGTYLTGTVFPFFKITEVSGPLQRLNSIFIIVLLSSEITLISTFLFCIKQYLKQTTNNYKSIFWMISVTVFLSSVLIKDNTTISDLLFSNITVTVIIIISAVIIPIIILVSEKYKTIIQKPYLIKRLSIFLIIPIAISLFLSGCNTTQLNQRLIIQGIGIDKKQNQYEITLIMLDTEAENSENTLIIKSFPGKTTAQAIKNSENITGKKILLSQCLFIMMNHAAARDLNNTIQYFADNNEIMKTTNIMISDDTANNTIKTAIEKLKFHSEDINVITDSNTMHQPVSHFTLFDYKVNQNIKYSSMIIPVIKYNKTDDILFSSDSVITDPVSNDTMAINESENLSALIINNKLQNYTLNNNKTKQSLNFKNSDTRIKTYIKNNRLNVEINIYIDINEKQNAAFLSEQIKTSLQSIIKRNGYDIIGIYKKLSEEERKGIRPAIWREMLKNSLIRTKILFKE